MSKCRFAMQDAKFLGHVVSKHGIRLDDDKKLEVRNLVLPDTVTKLRSFLGLVNFFADFIDHFAEKSHLLYALLKGKSGKKDAILWSSVTKQAFVDLKQSVVAAPMLHVLQPRGKVTLYTDASEYALGGHLTQIVDDREVSVLFVSKVFADVQRRWYAKRKCLLCIIA